MFSINSIEIKIPKDVEKLEKGEVYDCLKDWFSSTNEVLAKTSGSTGIPKQIRISKKAMLESAKLTASFFKLTPKDKALLCLPTQFIAGKMMVVRTIQAQLNLIAVPPSSNPLKTINETIDFAAMTPMQVKTVLKENPEKLAKIKTLIIGGAPVDFELEKQLASYPTKSYSTFGMTETITHIAVKELNKQNEFVGLPTITFEQTIEKCLVIKAPHLSKYPIITNDLVELTSATSFKWIGRKDNAINTGGIKLTAEQVEQELAQWIPYRFYITSKKDELLGEKIVLVIEVPSSLGKVNLDFSKVKKYYKPKEIIRVEKLEETKTGKIIRKNINSRSI